MKTYICQKCHARFTGSDIVNKNGGSTFECPKCGAKNADLYKNKGVKKKKWQPLSSFIKDNM